MMQTINFVWTWASILSGSLHDCITYNDTTCSGGISAVRAYLRYYENEWRNNNMNNNDDNSDNEQQTSLIIPRLDYQSAFVQMHELEWGVNRLVYNNRYKNDIYFAYPSLLSQNKDDFNTSQRDLSILQTLSWKPLMTNVNVPTSNTWNPYLQSIYFDIKTGLAVMSVDMEGQPFAIPSIESVTKLLHYIAKRNQNLSNCKQGQTETLYEIFLEQEVINNNNDNDNYNNYENKEQVPPYCWIPIIVFEETNINSFRNFINAMLQHEYPPALIIDVRGNDIEQYETPVYLESKINNNDNNNNNTKGVWVVSYPYYYMLYYQQRLIISNEVGSNMGKVINVTLINEDMFELPDKIKDDEFINDIQYMRHLADQAAINDPIIGMTTDMPITEDEKLSLRPCMGGECPCGNLFTDAIKWKSNADFAFVNSGGIRGLGWPAGNVTVSDIWAALPFPNTLCEGVMTGLSMFRLLNFSTSLATFETHFTKFGDRLLQVSGVRYTYNTELPQSGRLLKIEIFNETTQEYEPMERLKLYKFATDSWMCSGFDPFPSLLGDQLVISGEEKSTILSSGLIQNIVGEYLTNLGDVYNTSIQGRLNNDTSNVNFLDLMQTEDTCPPGTYWAQDYLTCFSCPESFDIGFVEDRISFNSAVQGSNVLFSGKAQIINNEEDLVVMEKKSSPDFLSFQSIRKINADGVEDIIFDAADSTKTAPFGQLTIDAGGSIVFEFTVTAEKLDVGTALRAASFAVFYGSGEFRGCVGRDATFEVLMKVSPKPHLHTPGSVRAAGITLMVISGCTAILFAVWVWHSRKHVVIKAMQPMFLIAVCAGSFIIALAIIPLTFEDEVVSDDLIEDGGGRNMTCMATPWLLSMGFTVVMGSLFAKLWRINKLFNTGVNMGVNVRRRTISTIEAFYAALALFCVNVVLLVIWTIFSPLEWEIRSISPDEPWSKYGSCISPNVAGDIFIVVTITFNAAALILACYEAYKARNISSDFSESKNLGFALFGWVEIILVGLPVLFLIENDNTNAKYFLQVSLIFAITMSMLLIIFLPLVLHVQQYNQTRRPQRSVFDTQNNSSVPYNNQHSNTTSAIVVQESAMTNNNSDMYMSRSMDDRNNTINLSRVTIEQVVVLPEDEKKNLTSDTQAPNSNISSTQQNGDDSSGCDCEHHGHGGESNDTAGSTHPSTNFDIDPVIEDNNKSIIDTDDKDEDSC